MIAQWPLAESKEHYRYQAQQLVDLLAELTKVRGVSPWIKLDDTGTLRHEPAAKNGKPEEGAVEWFNELNITSEVLFMRTQNLSTNTLVESFLEQRRDCTDEPIDFRDYEMRYTARILLGCMSY
jgi:hypothetical protein